MIFSKLILLFGAVVSALDHQRVKKASETALAPDDDDFDFAEDEGDDPADYSAKQFIDDGSDPRGDDDDDDDDDDSFLQARSKTKTKKGVTHEEVERDYFNTVAGAPEKFDEEDNSTFGHKLAYDDAFIQVALKAQQHKKHRQYAPDDDDFDFAEDDGDDPSNFSVEQFIGDDNLNTNDNGDVSTESDNDDDDSDYSFAQRNSGPGGKKKKKRARRNRKKKAKKQAAAAGSTTDATAAGGSQTEPAAGGSTTGSTATAASGNTASTTAAATAEFNSVLNLKKNRW